MFPISIPQTVYIEQGFSSWLHITLDSVFFTKEQETQLFYLYKFSNLANLIGLSKASKSSFWLTYTYSNRGGGIIENKENKNSLNGELKDSKECRLLNAENLRTWHGTKGEGWGEKVNQSLGGLSLERKPIWLNWLQLIWFENECNTR